MCAPPSTVHNPPFMHVVNAGTSQIHINSIIIVSFDAVYFVICFICLLFRFCLGYAMGRESQSPSLAAILLTEGLSEYLHVRSDMLETQVSIKSPRTCLLAEDFWTTSNLLISKGFVVLAKLGGSNDLTKRVCLLYSSRVVWWFPYTHKGSTFRQLQWTWVDSRCVLCAYVRTYKSSNSYE